MFLENQVFPDNTIDDEQISRAINNDHTAAMKAPSDSKKHKKKGTSPSMITVCMLCQKAFKSPAFYRKHLRLHAEKGRRHKHKRLKHQGRFQQQHQAGEGGERPFACNLCPKSFCIKSSLQRHLSCHTGEKPFVCGLCQRGYTRRSVLALHVQQVHEARKPFQCDRCQLRFSQKGNLQAHFRRKHLPPPAHPHQQQGKGKSRGAKRGVGSPPEQQGNTAAIRSYASKVKAIVSRGGQKRARYPEPVTSSAPSLCSLSSDGGAGGSSGGECFPEEDVRPLPDLESFLEGGRWEEFMLADSLLCPPSPYEVLPPKGEVLGWTDDCPLFTAEDLDNIKDISGSIYGMDAASIKEEPRNAYKYKRQA